MSDAPFHPVTRAQWQTQAEAELGGRPPSSLTRTTPDGVAVAPVYLRDDVEGAPGRAGLGTRATTRWRSIPTYRQADPGAADHAARRDLELGADGLWFVLDGQLRAGREPGEPADGLVADPSRDLDSLLAGVDPTQTPVFVDAGLCAPVWADALEQWLDDRAAEGPESATLGRGPSRGGVIYDPITPLLQTGSLELGFEAALTEQVDAMLGRSVGLIGVSLSPYHDAGASDADELALALATCAELLRRGDAIGLEPADLASSQIWTIALAGRPFEAIAKLRAARVVWAKFAVACGLAPEQRTLWIHATASQRTWTRHGPWVNLLRGTLEAFAGAVGGADSISTPAFDGLRGPERGEVDGLGSGSELGRRLALDTQVILREESGLDRTLDPAGGSWYVESLTDALARAAWQQFRELEASGGLVANLRSGAIQDRIAGQAASLRQRVATRKQPITGVTTYPVLSEQEPPAQAEEPSTVDPPEPLRSSPVLDPAEVARLPVLRLAAPFERLRDVCDRVTAERGVRPRIYAVNLGPLAAHQPRAEFAANLFGAAGIELINSDGFKSDGFKSDGFKSDGFKSDGFKSDGFKSDGVDAIAPAIARFVASGCALAIVCGRDSDYATLAAGLVEQLRASGAARVWIAGRLAEGWGLDPSAPPDSVFLGCDALAAGELALRTLGLLGEGN